MTAIVLAAELNTSTTALSQSIIVARQKGKVSGVWRVGDVLQEHVDFLRDKYKRKDLPPSVSSVNIQQQQLEDEERQQRYERRRQQQQLEDEGRQRNMEKEEQLLRDMLKQNAEDLERIATDYDKRPLAVFCFTLFVVNLIVVLPNVGQMNWYMKIGGVMVCSFAPFLEYRYSHILIEIWAKDKIVRKGILKWFYTEGLAVCLLIPAMIFQSHDVFKLSWIVLQPQGWFEKSLPIFLAFSYQLFGLMQTLHLPKKTGDKGLNKQNNATIISKTDL